MRQTKDICSERGGSRAGLLNVDKSEQALAGIRRLAHLDICKSVEWGVKVCRWHQNIRTI